MDYIDQAIRNILLVIILSEMLNFLLWWTWGQYLYYVQKLTVVTAPGDPPNKLKTRIITNLVSNKMLSLLSLRLFAVCIYEISFLFFIIMYILICGYWMRFLFMVVMYIPKLWLSNEICLYGLKVHPNLHILMGVINVSFGRGAHPDLLSRSRRPATS